MEASTKVEFKTITGDDWKRMFQRARTEHNSVSIQIKERLKHEKIQNSRNEK